MREVQGVTVCHGCDAVFKTPALVRREVAQCPRCEGELGRHPGRMRERLLPLTLACLILFAIANAFPIVEIEARGMHSQTTLVRAVMALAGEGRSLVALLVLLTTLLFPLLQLVILVYLLAPWRQARRPAGFAWLVRALQSLRPWGMIEVFLLGVLVAVVKLNGMATVIIGPALWAFGALTVLLTAVLSFDPEGFWELAFGPDESAGTR
ncbi:MAG: paraquat-inducible protein A [Variovorax sp.]